MESFRKGIIPHALDDVVVAATVVEFMVPEELLPKNLEPDLEMLYGVGRIFGLMTRQTMSVIIGARFLRLLFSR